MLEPEGWPCGEPGGSLGKVTAVQDGLGHRSREQLSQGPLGMVERGSGKGSWRPKSNNS